ncbi:MAG: AAA family ATPase [Thermonemataceae bacterium]|nr:AAA family ATPase [Thermonemataceae bacterium]
MQSNNKIPPYLASKNQLDFPYTLSTIDVFPDKATSSHVNRSRLFAAYFHTIPNVLYTNDIDCVKANEWFIQNYKDKIKNTDYILEYHNNKIETQELSYFICEDLMISFLFEHNLIRFYFKKTEISKIEEIINSIQAFKKRRQRQKPEISLLVQTQRGIDIKSLQISKPKLSIEDNYNEDFKEIHNIIFKRLSRKNDKGLVLLHGKPGTGKTSYIRYLIAALKKNVIFLPPNMVNAITSPELISILIDNPNSILVIEDAENIVIDRDINGISPVSALLNIADGLLADCLNIQIISSFNTDISKIDSALMRKGRLIARYDFKELEVEKAQRLSKKLGFTRNINQEMTLAEIYNQDETNFQQSRKSTPIGFQAINNSRLVEN